MQPLLFSVREATEHNRPVWSRAGDDVIYYKNHFAKSALADDGDNFMTASFAVKFPHDDDVCYLAYHFPYTYSKLMVGETRVYLFAPVNINNILLRSTWTTSVGRQGQTR